MTTDAEVEAAFVMYGDERLGRATIRGILEAAAAVQPVNDDLARLRASHERLLAALKRLDLSVEFDAQAAPCDCFGDTSELNAAFAQASAAIAAAEGGGDE